MVSTKHQKNDRIKRQELIDNVIGRGNIIDSFIIDKGHPNGAEIHNITDTAIIIIQNERTKKLVTMLIARPHQIKRYYEAEGREPPKKVVALAYEHYKKGYNNK